MNYSNQFGSNYPASLIDVGTKKDVDDTVIDNAGTTLVDLVNQYYLLVSNNDMDGAAAFYNENKSKLEPYMINMEYFNRMEEEIFNVALLALKKTNSIVSKKQPIFQQEDSIWYCDKE